MKHVFIGQEREIIYYCVLTSVIVYQRVAIQSYGNVSSPAARMDCHWRKNRNRMDFISHKRAGRQIGSGVKRNVVCLSVCQPALKREGLGKIHHQAVATNSDAEYVQGMHVFSACSYLIYSATNTACTWEGIPCTLSQHDKNVTQHLIFFSILTTYFKDSGRECDFHSVHLDSIPSQGPVTLAVNFSWLSVVPATLSTPAGDSIQRGPSQRYNYSAMKNTRGIPRRLWNSNVRYRIHKIIPLCSI